MSKNEKMLRRPSHLVIRDPERPWMAVSLCRQFETALPHPWDSYKRTTRECGNCKRIKRARGLGEFRMTEMPNYPGLTAQIGGWHYGGGMSW